MITELYFRVPEFIHLLTGSLSSLTNISIYLLYPLITTILLSCEFSFLFHFISFFDCSVQLVGFLVPRLGMEPRALAERAWSPNHLTTRVEERSREEVSTAQAVGSRTQHLVRTEPSSISLALSSQINPLPIFYWLPWWLRR